ncbi:hypothetical protein GCM10007978_19670 [Shewanella hanedai]|uniref:Uncharacterized protein n=1 Tax=Shewanella hanedai TaxID=25 RepID=A0A553JMA1_SHEHA|nr:hypothetical protein [Shewanella hanedai]TRY13577.1 hypothetical protein FN961_15180 [Shewanella hanedai]GGI81959.1 hypothetical protein GCM10007978_19670 [Shewanella hanedai]
MKHPNPKFDAISALRLRGMKVISQHQKVIQIDQPTADFKRMAVDIIENIKGIRRRCSAVQFHGVTVRWNEDK